MCVIAQHILEMIHKKLGNNVCHWEEKLGGWERGVREINFS